MAKYIVFLLPLASLSVAFPLHAQPNGFRPFSSAVDSSDFWIPRRVVFEIPAPTLNSLVLGNRSSGEVLEDGNEQDDFSRTDTEDYPSDFSSDSEEASDTEAVTPTSSSSNASASSFLSPENLLLVPSPEGGYTASPALRAPSAESMSSLLPPAGHTPISILSPSVTVSGPTPLKTPRGRRRDALSALGERFFIPSPSASSSPDSSPSITPSSNIRPSTSYQGSPTQLVPAFTPSFTSLPSGLSNLADSSSSSKTDDRLFVHLAPEELVSRPSAEKFSSRRLRLSKVHKLPQKPGSAILPPPSGGRPYGSNIAPRKPSPSFNALDLSQLKSNQGESPPAAPRGLRGLFGFNRPRRSISDEPVSPSGPTSSHPKPASYSSQTPSVPPLNLGVVESASTSSSAMGADTSRRLVSMRDRLRAIVQEYLQPSGHDISPRIRKSLEDNPFCFLNILLSLGAIEAIDSLLSDSRLDDFMLQWLLNGGKSRNQDTLTQLSKLWDDDLAEGIERIRSLARARTLIRQLSKQFFEKINNREDLNSLREAALRNPFLILQLMCMAGDVRTLRHFMNHPDVEAIWDLLIEKTSADFCSELKNIYADSGPETFRKSSEDLAVARALARDALSRTKDRRDLASLRLAVAERPYLALHLFVAAQDIEGINHWLTHSSLTPSLLALLINEPEAGIQNGNLLHRIVAMWSGRKYEGSAFGAENWFSLLLERAPFLIIQNTYNDRGLSVWHAVLEAGWVGGMRLCWSRTPPPKRWRLLESHTESKTLQIGLTAVQILASIEGGDFSKGMGFKLAKIVGEWLSQARHKQNDFLQLIDKKKTAAKKAKANNSSTEPDWLLAFWNHVLFVVSRVKQKTFVDEGPLLTVFCMRCFFLEPEHHQSEALEGLIDLFSKWIKVMEPSDKERVQGLLMSAGIRPCWEPLRQTLKAICKDSMRRSSSSSSSSSSSTISEGEHSDFYDRPMHDFPDLIAFIPQKFHERARLGLVDFIVSWYDKIAQDSPEIRVDAKAAIARAAAEYKEGQSKVFWQLVLQKITDKEALLLEPDPN